VRATLIISPLQIQQQWVEETKRHAPSLKIYVYTGVLGPRGGRGGQVHGAGNEEARAAMEVADVVFTTYSALTEDLAFSKSRSYEEFSPLLQLQWWRICLDEAQMVHDSNSAAAQMASELWRVNGWCVTGTPLTKSIEDLHGLLVFLDHDPFAEKSTLVRLLLRPYQVGQPEDVVAVCLCLLLSACYLPFICFLSAFHLYLDRLLSVFCVPFVYLFPFFVCL
jgi:SNF2 family DNA or RNA helicase